MRAAFRRLKEEPTVRKSNMLIVPPYLGELLTLTELPMLQ
jgi:hypothetical protein